MRVTQNGIERGGGYGRRVRDKERRQRALNRKLGHSEERGRVLEERTLLELARWVGSRSSDYPYDC